MWARRSSLALVSVGAVAGQATLESVTLHVGQSTLESITLRPVVNGIATKEELHAGPLWRDRGAVILAARRPG